MGGVDITLQAAAALDRRGITARVENQDVVVLIDHDGRTMRIQPRRHGIPPHQHGREWEWGDSDESCRHPRDDYEGLAEAFEKYLRERPEFAGTRVLYRMDHMGWTWQEEDDEALERAHAKIAEDPAKVDQLTRMGIWPPRQKHSDTGTGTGPSRHRRPGRA